MSDFMVKRGLLLDDQAPAKFVDASGVLYVSLKAPSQVSSGNVFITLPANQPISGTILIANASGELCWCPILKSGDVTSGFIGNASVVSGSIASGQIGSIHLASGTIPAGFALSSGIITSGYIGNAAVTSGNVASGQIGHFHIADNAVQSGNIASGNVGIYKLDALTTTYTANSGLIVGQVLTYTGSGMIWQDSEKEILIVRNDTGVTITKGSVVYISGGLGNKPLVTLASASSESASSKTIGVMQDDLANNEEGRCLVSGILEDVNTNSYAAGDRLYLSITAGQWTTTRYQPPVGHQVYIGTVVRSHINFGRIAITIQNGFEVNELHDVRVMSGSYASGQVLQYTTQSGGYWQNVMYSVGSGYIGNGAILSGNIASGQIDLFHLASGTVFSGTFVTSGSVQSGSLGNASVVSGSIGSGQIGLSHLASGTVFSGTFLLSGNVTSGYIGNSSVNSGNITLGVIGNIHIASGGLTSGAISSGSIGSVHLADGAVQSGDISSGQIGRMHLSSGAVNSGHLAANSVVSGDIASGTITGGSSGQVQVNNGAALTGSSGLTWDGTILSANQLTLTNSVGDEGGEILLAKAQTNTTLSGTGVTIDVYQDRLRFFEQGGNARGFYLQITSGGGGVSTNIMADGAVVLQSGQVQSGLIGNNAVVSGSIASGQIGQFHHASGSVTSGHIGNNAVVSGSIASGQIGVNHLISGLITTLTLGSGQVTSGIIASGSIGSFHLANGAILSGDIASGQIGQFHLSSGTVNSGHIGNNAVVSGSIASGQIGQFHLSNNSVFSGAIASGQIGNFHLSSGAVTSGDIGNNAVVSGSIASGQVGINHLVSGLITTLTLGSGQVTSGNIASGVIFRLLSGNITSGFIGNNAVVSGSIASGQVGQYHLSNNSVFSGAIASGQIGNFHLSSGAVTSGDIGNNAVVSGSIASGQIGQFHHASGSVTSGHIGNNAVVSGSMGSGLIVGISSTSGNLAVGTNSLNVNRSGGYNTAIGTQALNACYNGGFNTAVGYQALATVSGEINANDAFGAQSLSKLEYGANNVSIGGGTLSNLRSGGLNTTLGAFAGQYVSGDINTFTRGSGNIAIGFATKFATDDTKNQIVIGFNATGIGSDSTVIGNNNIISGRIFGNINFPHGLYWSSGNIVSGGALVSTFGSGTITSGAIASGQIGKFHLSNNSVFSGNVSSSEIGAIHLASGAVTSGAIASGVIGVNHLSQIIQNNIQQKTNDFRLSVQSGVAITSTDQSGQSTLYLVPYTGNTISLHDGTNWKTSIASGTVVSLSITGLTSGRPYDVFAYDNSGVPALEFGTVWTTVNTRADAIQVVDGVSLKSGTLTRRLIGTILPTAPTTTNDTAIQRYVHNFDNQVSRRLFVGDATSHTYASTTNRIWNLNSGIQIQYVASQDGIAGNLGMQTASRISTGASFARTQVTGGTNQLPTTNNGISTLAASGALLQYMSAPSATHQSVLGYNYFYPQESVTAAGATGTFAAVDLFGEIKG